jgi:hypothetical protein
MGIVQTVLYSGYTLLKVLVSKTTDPDTQATIAHGMGNLPGFNANQVKVTIVPLSGGVPSNNSAGWVKSTVDNTNVYIVGASATASSTTAAQIEVMIEAPHSLAK